MVLSSKVNVPPSENPVPEVSAPVPRVKSIFAAIPEALISRNPTALSFKISVPATLAMKSASVVMIKPFVPTSRSKTPSSTKPVLATKKPKVPSA